MSAAIPLTLPPDLRARLRTLRLSPRLASGASGIGQHASRSRGAGLEFAQYRAYEPGDALRQIDWKLYARSDRFFVRESERESPITVWLLLDATASAGQADRAAPQRTRLDHMRGIAACVLELALQQGDRFGLLAISGVGLQLVPAASGARQRDRIHLQLHALQARGAWPVAERLRPLWERVRPGDLLLALGDGFDEAGIALLEQLAGARREVMLLQILTADERDFPFDVGHRFRDPETGDELLGDGAAIRSDYLQRFAAARTALQSRLQASGIASATGWLDQPLDQPLQALFGRRGSA
ncbi:DUF58 domain-containing protein [Stenotrophomonas sp. YAU14D1_LEIMI4_1]|uniref:DUF58 domain-containing protein n=1 Tax=Stenotrophomonas sp. YAU14D1_LEIMI4_1 TaxID=2072407 RepID=UPI000D53C4F6|nr:DUF58 domain-containing protein [Stenotrophomonas sp. YAU14D1_LEIMI4_1]AWH23719.1 DUF58 domain-containing protein [Stenotrophomonas sp. YAU14D1_LEIMI4_1]